MEARPPADLRVLPSPGRGRGVFATRSIARGEVVEIAPVVVIPPEQHSAVYATVLADYVFEWGEGVAVALGFGSLYNHAWAPNLEYRKRIDQGLIEFVAIQDVAPGQELTTNYASSRPDRAALWADLD